MFGIGNDEVPRTSRSTVLRTTGPGCATRWPLRKAPALAAMGTLAALIVAGAPFAAQAQDLPGCVRAGAYFCGGTLVGGSVLNVSFGGVAGADGAFITHAGQAPMSQVGAGAGGVLATAFGFGDFGIAHLSAATDLGEFNVPQGFGSGTASAFAESLISYGDTALVVPGPLGSLQHVVIGAPIDGVFVGGGILTTNLVVSTQRTGLLMAVNSGIFQPGARSIDLSQGFDLLGGDIVSYSTEIRVEAAGGNDGFAPVVLHSVADVSHTSHLFFDDTTLGQGLVGQSGHNYGSAAFLPGGGAVPEPSAWALLIAGFGGAGAALRRARRRPVGMAGRSAPSSDLPAGYRDADVAPLRCGGR